MKHLLKSAILALGLLELIAIPFVAFATTHTLQFVQTPTITLYSSLSGSATSMRVTPYPKDLDGTKLTISSFGSSPTLTVDPKVKNIEEIIQFTGITDNGDNTATLTGLTRDYISQYPYTTTGTGRSHTAGAIVVFSNNPQMYNRLAAWENDGTITGVWTYTTSPVVPTPTTATQATSKAYVDNIAFSGAGVISATEAARGVVELGTAAEQASSTTSGSSGPLAMQTRYATDTPTYPCNSLSTKAGAGCAVIGDLFGHIAAAFVASSTNLSVTASTTLTASTSVGNFMAGDVGHHETYFTSTTTWAIPAGVTSVFARLQGPGGNGVSGSNCNPGGSPGGYVEGWIDVHQVSTLQVDVSGRGNGSNTGWARINTTLMVANSGVKGTGSASNGPCAGPTGGTFSTSTATGVQLFGSYGETGPFGDTAYYDATHAATGGVTAGRMGGASYGYGGTSGSGPADSLGGAGLVILSW